MPNAVADALNSIPIKTGAESSFIGFFQLTGSSVLNFWISTFISNFFHSILIVFIMSGFILLTLNKFAHSKKKSLPLIIT